MKMLSVFLITLTFSIPYSTFCDKRKIPEHVLEDLRNSRTLHEVTRKMQARHGITFDKLPGKVKIAGPFSTRTTIQGLGRAAHPRNEFHIFDPGMVEVIDNPIQSKDSCQLFNICVALPMMKEPDMFYFPECIDLPQCLGACCDGSRDCRPKKIQAVKVKVTVWKYKGISDGRHQFLPDHNTHIEVKKHLQCNCDRCLIKPHCDERQHLVGCECECNNEHEATTCTGQYRIWSRESCSCECNKNSTCNDGYYFSYPDCACMPTRLGFRSPGSGNDD